MYRINKKTIKEGVLENIPSKHKPAILMNGKIFSINHNLLYLLGITASVGFVEFSISGSYFRIKKSSDRSGFKTRVHPSKGKLSHRFISSSFRDFIIKKYRLSSKENYCFQVRQTNNQLLISKPTLSKNRKK